VSVLLDVNVLLAYGWQHHPDHVAVSTWLEKVEKFALCPITELGFVRVSMSPAFRASHEAASKILSYISNQTGAIRIPCDLAAIEMPRVGELLIGC
jgi:predicted nucleic acid-binding protein